MCSQCQMSEDSFFAEWLMFLRQTLAFHVRKYIFATFPNSHAKWVRTVCFCVMIDVSTLTHLAWKRLQIYTFWHEKAGVLCRNINHYRPLYIWSPPKNVHQIKWQTKGRLNNVDQIKCQTEGRRKNKIATNFGWSSKKRPPKCKLPWNLVVKVVREHQKKNKNGLVWWNCWIDGIAFLLKLLILLK